MVFGTTARGPQPTSATGCIYEKMQKHNMITKGQSPSREQKNSSDTIFSRLHQGGTRGARRRGSHASRSIRHNTQHTTHIHQGRRHAVDRRVTNSAGGRGHRGHRTRHTAHHKRHMVSTHKMCQRGWRKFREKKGTGQAKHM